MQSREPIKESELIVQFKKQITSASIEETLSVFYRKSRNVKVQSVVFDLEYCEWCEMYSLSLLSLWIWELRLIGKALQVIFPKNSDVHRFLVSYRFMEFLEEHNVKFVHAYIQGVYPRMRQEVSPSYPLTFVSQKSFKTLLADLKDPNRLSVLLSGMEESEIVKSGAFRSVLLKELGDNIFLHGDGKAGHLMMTKINSLSVNIPTRSKKAPENVIYNSLKGLAGKSILEIVIGDKGTGIANLMRPVYALEKGISDDATIPECDLIEYAFLYHTSRRSPEERLGEFLSHYSKGSLPPPTGLYQLKELVRDYRGVLCIRSGASFVAYDFSTDSMPQVVRSDQVLGSSSLCDFGGVQYRILIPTNQIARPEIKAKPAVIAEKFASMGALDQEHVSIADFIAPEHLGDVDKEGRGIFKLLETVDRASVSSKPQMSLVIVDFEATEDLSTKSTYSILSELSHRQSPAKTIIAINVNQSSISALPYEKHSGELIRSPNTLAFDNDAVPYVFWVTSHLEKQQLVGCALALGKSSDASNNQTTLRTSLLSIPRNAIRNRIEKYVLSPESVVFQEGVKVLLLSDGYSSGYFEINKLFQSARSRALIVRWFVYQMMDLELELIVSLGSAMGKIIDEANKTLQQQVKGQPIDHINLRTDSRGRVAITRLLLVETGKKVLVVGDVVGTARSMLDTIRRLRHAKIQRVIAVVDARENNGLDSHLGGTDFELTSIVRKPLKYYRELPPGWLYHEIFQVDPDTHVLVRKIIRPKGPLWIESPNDGKHDHRGHNEFLEKIVIPERAFFSGHFVTGKKHMTHMFDVSRILTNHEVEITAAIHADIQSVEAAKRFEDRKDVLRVIFPMFNRGLDLIAKKIASEYQKTITLPIAESQLRSVFDQLNGELSDMCVVVLDDATDSGETMLRLVDLAERMGASRIYGYVLINRGDAYSVSRLEKLHQYGAATTHVRYLSEAQLPSYVIESCPLCQRRHRLDQLFENFGHESRFGMYLNDVMEALSEQSASSIGQGREVEKRSLYTSVEGKKLSLRQLIAEAEIYPELRHALTEVLRNFEVDRESAIALLGVLANENILPTNRFTGNSRLFYSSFIEAVKTVTGSLIRKQLIMLSPEQIGEILTVADAFHEAFILDNVEQLLNETIAEVSSFSRVALCILDSKACQANAGIIASVFAKLSKDVPNDLDSIQQLCDEMKQYWQAANREHSGRRSLRLDAYRELQGGRSHDLDHQYRDLLMRIGDGIREGVQEYWATYQSNLLDILSLVRLLISSGISHDLCNSLESKRVKLMRRLKEIDESMSLRDNKSRSVDDEILRLLEASAKETKHAWANILQELDKLKTNLKDSLFAVLTNCKEDLENKGIICVRHQPDDLCMVFGESSDIRLALNNLVDNVCNWSQAKQLLIEITIEPSTQSIVLKMFDDGIGASDLFSGVGLTRVREIASSLEGQFKLDEVLKDSLRFKEGFRTVAILELPSVPSKGNPT